MLWHIWEEIGIESKVFQIPNITTPCFKLKTNIPLKLPIYDINSYTKAEYGTYDYKSSVLKCCHVYIKYYIPISFVYDIYKVNTYNMHQQSA